MQDLKPDDPIFVELVKKPHALARYLELMTGDIGSNYRLIKDLRKFVIISISTNITLLIVLFAKVFL